MRWAALLAIVLPAVLCVGAAVLLSAPSGSKASSASAPAANLTCTVKASCGVNELPVLRMSSSGNAHAGTSGGSGYGLMVCCTKISGLSTQCSGTHDVVLSLSGADNAHVASDGSYATRACLSGGDDSAVDCTYAGECPPDYACLATISESTNAHVADCDGVSDYGIEVCCKALADNCPTLSNPGQENQDGDQWGDACDNCPATSTPWLVPSGDADCDGFSSSGEAAIGTDPGDACPDATSDDAWPPDTTNNTIVNILDVAKFRIPFGSCSGDPAYNRRYDLNPNDCINILDVAKLRPYFMLQCTNP